jgi:hypothetical protein
MEHVHTKSFRSMARGRGTLISSPLSSRLTLLFPIFVCLLYACAACWFYLNSSFWFCIGRKSYRFGRFVLCCSTQGPVLPRVIQSETHPNSFCKYWKLSLLQRRISGTRERERERERYIHWGFFPELISCFPLIRHGPHRKRSLQQLFVAVGTCLLTHCLAMIRGYTYRHRLMEG